MEDPLPENIDGSKRVSHSVEHRIDWGHVALGVGGVAAAYVLWKVIDSSSTSTDAVAVEVEEESDGLEPVAPGWS